MELKLTKSGQIYLPNCIRNDLNLEPGDSIYIYMEIQKIILAKNSCEKENQWLIKPQGNSPYSR